MLAGGWYFWSKYQMRASDFIDEMIRPKPPLTPEQARINTLQQSVESGREQVERSRQALSAERERQRRQRETERQRKQAQKQAQTG
jgi:hypothetical protein